MNVISAEELKKKIEQKDDFKLVNPLDEDQFRSMHISGSINLSLKVSVKNETIKEDIEKVLNLDDEIVVYCTSEGCLASRFLYDRLEEYGYKKISRFSGGLHAWDEAGYDLVREKTG